MIGEPCPSEIGITHAPALQVAQWEPTLEPDNQHTSVGLPHPTGVTAKPTTTGNEEYFEGDLEYTRSEDETQNATVFVHYMGLLSSSCRQAISSYG